MTPILNTLFPEFKLNAYHNGAFKQITNEDLKGHWSLVVFYPGDFTFVCPTELEDLADKYEEFKKLGVEVYSCSCDTHFVHKAWQMLLLLSRKYNTLCWQIQQVL